MPQKSITDLNQLYGEMDQVDQEVFAEMRGNLLLVSGEHYSKYTSRYWNRIRDSGNLASEQKLRLTQNHTQKISKIYKNNILSYSPGVTVVPHNDTELQDIKDAELSESVWMYGKNRYKLKEKTREWCSEFVDIGEVAVKIFYDPDAGKFLGHEAEMGEDGQPVVGEDGEMVSSKNAKFSGDFIFETVFGFNLLRPKDCKKLSEAKVLCIRKMAGKTELESRVEGDPEKIKLLKESHDRTYMVFNQTESMYGQSKDDVMLREYYYRPCHEYPQGYYYITTEDGILWEGELPFGVFPIITQTFDDYATTPRGRSIIKQIRPYQAEVNRAASKMAEHQITLGDDKLLIQSGTKIANGGQAPGIRAVTYSGVPPTILAGRDGSQYLAYMNAKIEEMYAVAMIHEDMEKKQDGVIDPYTMLFKSLKQKKSFGIYSTKFEQFLTDVCVTYLQLAKHYFDDERVIHAVGRREQLNLVEFRGTDEMSVKIKVEAQSDDLETKMGKQITMTQFLQYAGSQLDKEDIGKILKNMPFANVDESFNDLTIDYENSKNIILQMDRGEAPYIGEKDNHNYMIKKLTHRVKMADFRFLPPQVQQLYSQTIEQYNQLASEELQKLQALEQGFIPAQGHLVPVDFYVVDPASPGKTRRARIPYDSLNWLIKKLEVQGLTLDALEEMQTSAQAGIAKHALSSGAVKPQAQFGEGGSPGQGLPSSPPPISGMPPGG
jgi:hypothetical protein